jgi:cyclic pyranopterin phosphate synthase
LEESQIKDLYGRIIDNLRISITQRCNLNCGYCHHEGEKESKRDKMSTSEILKIINLTSQLGINKIKLTGGEPLLREDVFDIIKKIREIKSIKDISLTTNGVLLSEKAFQLKKAGLNRINISLDTITPEKYKIITGTDYLPKVINGIDRALEANLNPVKINMVLLKGLNDDEVVPMIEWSKKKEVILQLIELIPLGRMYRKFHFKLNGIERYLEQNSIKIVNRKLHHRKKYFLNPTGQVEIVKPVHNTNFCANCTRIRLTSDGYLKPCLMRDDNLIDILTPLRKRASDEVLKDRIIQAINLREPYYKE